MPKYTNTSINTLGSKRDGKAVAALVCAILGLVAVPLLLGGTAIVLGVQSRKKITVSQGLLTGEGIAKAAVIIGILDVVLSVLLITLG